MPPSIMELRTAHAILMEKLRHIEATLPPDKGLANSLQLAIASLDEQIIAITEPADVTISDKVFYLLTHNYRQHGGPNQRRRGRQYMTAETHELADLIVGFITTLQEEKS